MLSTTEYTREERKTNGVFYTPGFVADYLAQKVSELLPASTRSITALDPACGDSALLLGLANIFQRTKSDKSFHFFGLDKDINAVGNSVARFDNKHINVESSQFLFRDALFPYADKSSKEGWRLLRTELNVKRGFDVALSNPPWGADLDGYVNSVLGLNFSLAKGQFDIYDLFVETVLENLTEDGVYGFVLPDSIFSQEQASLRCLLSKNTTIELIARLGEKIFPEINRACVILVGKKRLPHPDHLVDCFRLSVEYKRKVIFNKVTLLEAQHKLSHKIPQRRFTQNKDYIFDIDLNIAEESTFKKIEAKSFAIKSIVENTRGAEISKKGKVCQCSECQSWIPFPKSKKPKCSICGSKINLSSAISDTIILNHNGSGNLKLKVGEDLFRFTSISKRWINIAKKGINYKDLSIYNGPKILVRKTGVGITASIDYEGAITNQVVYILRLKPEYKNKMTLEFVLAVLNSRAMTYYLIKKYGENQWKSHPYLTQNMLANLPFPKIDLSSVGTKKMIKRVTSIIRKDVNTSKEKNISKNNDIEIEKYIAQLFNLTRTDYETIFNALESSEQLIPIKRLLNCTIKDIFE
jgi:adenine-specific DNA-methyltransferase